MPSPGIHSGPFSPCSPLNFVSHGFAYPGVIMFHPIILSLILFLTAGFVPLYPKGTRTWLAGAVLSVAGGVCAIISALFCLLGYQGGSFFSGSITPLFPVEIGMDRLSSAFILLLGILSIAVCMYTPGYAARLHGNRRRDLLCSLIPLFVGSMLLVLLSQTTFLFLAAWELMAVISFFLVLIEYQEKKTRYASFFYFSMTQLSTVCIFLGIISLYCITGSMQFPHELSGETIPGLVSFLLLFFGASIKAGVIPFHKWLPHAHPAAASPVSALMSGMMLNCALYVIIMAVYRFFVPTFSMGLLILVFGCLTAVLGVMYALKEEDIKGLLAYSSIDNTGVILIGTGLFVILQATGQPVIATMALLGAVFHAVSHGLFKGLLFLTAGSVNLATGTRNIDELGGLLVRMPWTGGLFFIGTLSICAVPPFNGFAGELLIYQAFFSGIPGSEPMLQVLLLIALSLFGLCGALTAVCFVKAFGLTFLALPRTDMAKKAREIPLIMQAGPILLAGACLLSGVFSSQILAILGYPGFLSDLFHLSVLLLISMLLMYAAVYAGACRKTRVSATWSCGMNRPTSRMEYTGSGFTEPVVRIFSPVYRTRIFSSKRYYDGDNCFIRDGQAGIALMKFFEEYLYLPAARMIERYADKVAALQNGRIDTYVLYVFGTVVLLIVMIWGAF